MATAMDNELQVAAKTILQPGDSHQVQSLTSDSIYTIKRDLDTYVCSCPAWRIQKHPIDARTCKHLKELLGVEYETARLARLGVAMTTSAPEDKKSKAKGKVAVKKAAGTKRKAKAEEEEVEEDEAVEPAGEQKRVVKVLLAKTFEMGKVDPKGWWMSEKLDGIRAYWDGEGSLWSRLGNRFRAPKWFTDQLPQGHTLDGELFHSRNNFSLTSSIVRSHGEQRWDQLKYQVGDARPSRNSMSANHATLRLAQVFDIPSRAEEPFERRLEILQEMFPGTAGSSSPKSKENEVVTVVEIVAQNPCRGINHLVKKLRAVEQGGGEGLMLREPKSVYVNARSSTLLKCKSFFDAEAVVIGYEPGKGKYKGLVGSLICQMESKRQFSCGSGLSDAQRSDPPSVGTIISYRFQEITKDNVPRFPTFLGERIDMDQAKDADLSSKDANAALSASAGPSKKKAKKE